MLSRRALLLGGTAVGAGVVAGVSCLGDDGSPGVVPDVEPGPVVQGSFTSAARLGAETGWCLITPPGEHSDLPLVVALHGHGADHESLLQDQFALDRYLAAAVADGVPPFAIAAADGGGNYWHPRPDGDDASAMVVDELLPLVAEQGVRTDRFGLLGWSMGGYGALRLGALLGPDRVTAIVAASPAVWRDPEDASRKGFADAAEYEQYSVMGDQDQLDGIPVRIDCGTGDPFYREVQAYVDGFPDDADVTSTFEPGAHDAGYWRRMLPAQLAFLGERVVSAG